MQFLAENDWAIFIGLEVSAFIFIIIFMGARYLFSQRKVSIIFLGLFFMMMVLEGILAVLVYQVTGEVSTFQVVIVLFLLYAVTFGIQDFKKLDFSARVKIGKWRKMTLVTEEEVERMRALKHPKVLARKSRRWFYAHTIMLIIGLIYLWNVYGASEYGWIYFIQHLDWFGDESLPQPFTSEMVAQVVRLWLIIYAVDTVINWSYTLFPDKVADE